MDIVVNLAVQVFLFGEHPDLEDPNWATISGPDEEELGR